MSSPETSTVPDHKAINKKYVHEGLVSYERHFSRQHTKDRPSINFVSHAPINSYITTRQQTGGSFENHFWSKTQARLGTA